ncbi:MAG: tail fiber domain-containing protein [Candidatus Zixiibacteriota bacterium]
MPRFISILAGLFVLVFLASLSLAGIPKLINYQGMLTDNSGTPLNGTYSIIFKIYNAESSGTKKWEETQSSVAVTNGLFNVVLGSVSPLNLDFSEDYWLDITVGGEQMPSRLKFTSVGYAYRAMVADSAAKAGATGGGWTDDGTVVRLNTITDTVGIGTTNAKAKFHSEGSWILGITNSILPVNWGYGFKGWLTSDNGIRYEGGGDSVAHLFTAYGMGDIVRFGKSSEQGQEVNIKFVIDSSGSVGIGTTNPGGYLLAVNGTAAKTGGGSWSVFSDERLKDISANYECGLTEISQLKPVRYSYKKENELGLPSSEEFVGLVAQDVQGVIPDAVKRDDNGYLMLNNDPVIWAMLNAIKALKAENELLRKRVEVLESR